MIYAAIMSGGMGSRMGISDMPKQYLDLCGKPIIVRTVEKFCLCSEIKRIAVFCPQEWQTYTKDILNSYMSDEIEISRIVIAAGGKTRHDTLGKALDFIIDNYGCADDDIIITHDAVRPFVNEGMIMDSVDKAAKCGAATLAVPATDTLVESQDATLVTGSLNRSIIYHCQTPQTFNLKKLKKLYDSFGEDDAEYVTDATQIFTLRGENVALAKGDRRNIKITYPHDLRIAEEILSEFK